VAAAPNRIGDRQRQPQVQRCRTSAFLHRAECSSAIRIAHELAEAIGNDLPGAAELVEETSALHVPAVLAQVIAVAVELILVIAIDDEGDRRRELLGRTAVERHERGAVELEGLDHRHGLLTRLVL
jgi:hypothetical protein